MSEEIQLIKNNDNKELSDVEWISLFNDFLMGDLKLSCRKAFRIIYFLQEHLPVFPDHIEKCDTCGSIYDSWSQGHHSDMNGKFYCSENCEPNGLYEKEEAWENERAKLLRS